ncbi:MAG: DNA polymerase III subunit delta [Chitinophagaceae bacterium]|nr:DNA polymerase III subunit delta [Chitinophagaceae bacterium]
MSVEKVFRQFQQKQFKPVYWLEGEEPFFIDQVVEMAEKSILNESEAAFNLSIFYGRDANWADVVNACRRYPVFAERQVVILKEAQGLKDIEEKLETYVENPLSSTIFVVGYKDKKVDGRKRFAKLLKEKGELITTKKLYENQLPEWVTGMVQSRGFSIDQKAVFLLVENIGNDLGRLWNEIGKVTINLESRKHITVDDIEEYVGISKEYNALELQSALTQRSLTRCLQIIQFFESNPKALPIQMLLPSLYTFFSKAYLVFGSGTNNEFEISKYLGYNGPNPYVKDIIQCARNYRQKGVEQAILLLHEYNLKSIGIYNNSTSTSEADLLKEMIVKMVYASQQA